MDMDLSDDIYNYNLGMTVERDLYLTGDESISFRAYFKNCSITQLCDLSILTKEQLLVLLKFSNMLMSQIMPVKCILLTLKTIRSNLNIDLVEICYPDKDNNNLVIHYMLKDGVLHKKEINLINNGIFNTVFNTGDIIKIDNCHNDQRFIPIYDQHTDIIINNILLCPLFDSNHIVWGIAAVSNITSNDYQHIDTNQYIHSPKPGYHTISHHNTHTSHEIITNVPLESNEVQSNSPPPEVTTTVGLADSSSNYLSLKSIATPRDRGGREGCDGSSIMGMMEDGSKDVLDVTSSGVPGSDLRELEGEVNKEAPCNGNDRPQVESCLQDKDRTSSGDCKTTLDVMVSAGECIKECELTSNEDLNSSTEAGTVNNSSFESIHLSANTCNTNARVTSTNCPNTLRPIDRSSPEVQSNSDPTRRGASSNYLSLKSRATPGDRGEGGGVDESGMKNSIGPRVEPAADLGEAEGEVNKGGSLQEEDKEGTSSGTSSCGVADKYLLECYGNSGLDTSDNIKNKLNTLYNIEKSINPIQYPSSYNQKHIPKTITLSNKPNENHTSSYTHTHNSTIDDKSTNCPTSLRPAESSPLEVQSTSPCLADSSSNYLSLKSKATPGDRGSEEGSTRPQVEPGSDLRELEGEVNKEAVCKTTSGETSSGMESRTVTPSGGVPSNGEEVGLEKCLDGMDMLSSMGSLKIVDVGIMDENVNILSNDLVSCDKTIWDLNTITFILQICETGGRCISTAIHQRELNATKERANGLLTLMHSLFSDRLGIQSCVVALTTHAKKLLQAERCTVYIVDRYHNHLWSISSDDGRQIITPLTHGLAAQCVNNGEVIVIENAYEDDRFDSDVDSRFGVDIRNVAWVPIKSEDCDRVLAVIEVINKQAEELLHFGEDDLRILEIFATIVGPQFDKSDFANFGNVDQTTEAGLAFENIQPMGSTSLQRIAEYSIKETEED